MSGGAPHAGQLSKRHAAAAPHEHMTTENEHETASALETQAMLSFEQRQQQSPPHAAHACSAHVLVPSAAAWKVLVAVPLLLWLLMTAVGMAQFRELPVKKSDVEHFMEWFDAMFRVVGPLLPLLPWLMRWAALDGTALLLRHLLKPGPRYKAGAAQAARATLPWLCLAVYTAVAVLRVLLYLGHLALQRHGHASPGSSSNSAAGMVAALGSNSSNSSAAQADLVPATPSASGAWVSDHVFLAASVVACLHSELICSLSDIIKLEVMGAGFLREAAIAGALMTSLVTYVFVCIDMYFTCRFYHHPVESLGGVLSGLMLFQIPLLMWLVSSRRRKVAC